MQINFATFSLLKLSWNTEVKHSKQLARIARMTFLLIFFARGREGMDNTEGGLMKRNWKLGKSSKQIIISN